jgi:CelD/BcsL family acetyltransferase involved in cellulose biosynthesis
MSQEGLVRLYELELDSKPAASVLCFDQGGRYYLYNSGYDPDLSGLAVGIVSKALCLQEAIEAKRTRFDFLRGHEAYKYDLGGRDQQVCRVLLRCP